MFEGMIWFTFDKNGWRILATLEQPILFTEAAFSKTINALIVAGHFTKKPRAGTYCKRPHLLISQYY